MKRIMTLLIVLIMFVATGCSNKQEPVSPDELCLVKVETEGIGQIATAQGEEELVFDDEFPVTSSYMNVVAGTQVKMAARQNNQDWMFVKWKKDDADFSTEAEITVTVDEPVSYLAVFALSNGYDGHTASTIEEAKTIGDILGLPSFGYSAVEGSYIAAFELNGTVYRAVADLSKEQFDSIMNLQFDDPDHDRKLNEIVAPLEIRQIDNVSEKIPDQSELDKYIGKSGADLLDEGWTCTYYNLDNTEFGMDHGWYSYIVTFDGKIEYKEDLDVEEAIRDLKVLSVTYEGVSNAVTDPAE